jgi:hypothetical protein
MCEFKTNVALVVLVGAACTTMHACNAGEQQLESKTALPAGSAVNHSHRTEALEMSCEPDIHCRRSGTL